MKRVSSSIPLFIIYFNSLMSVKGVGVKAVMRI